MRHWSGPSTLLIIFLSLFITAACLDNDKGTTSEEVLYAMSVGGVLIPEMEIEGNFRSALRNPSGFESTRDYLDTAIRVAANRVLFYLKGRELGLEKDPDFILLKRMLTKQWIGYRLKKIWGPVDPLTVSEYEVAEHEPAVYERAWIRQITVLTRQEAEKVYSNLVDGADFATIAKQDSIDPASSKGGRVREHFTRGKENLYSLGTEESIFALEKGEFSDPVKTPMGWTIFLLEKREALPEDTVKAVKENIRNSILLSKRNQWEREIIESFPMKILEEGLAESIADSSGEDNIIATVGKEKVTLKDARTYARWRGDEPVDRDAWVQLLRDLTTRLAFYQEAVRRGLDRHPDVQKSIELYHRKSVAMMYIEKLKEKIEITEEELFKSYQHEILRRRAEDAGGWFDVRVLVTDTRGDADAAVTEISQGQDWESVSARYRTLNAMWDDQRYLVTRMPYLLYRALYGLESKMLAGPLERDEGVYTVYQMVERKTGRVPDFPQVRDKVRRSLEKKRHESIQKEVLAEARKKYPVKVFNQEALVAKAEEWFRDILRKKNIKEFSSPHGGSPH